MSRRRSRRPTRSELRRRRQDRIGMAICGAVLLSFAGILWGAYSIDKAHGITVSQSLHNWGF